jgi:hypothetical protein
MLVLNGYYLKCLLRLSAATNAAVAVARLLHDSFAVRLIFTC